MSSIISEFAVHTTPLTQTDGEHLLIDSAVTSDPELSVRPNPADDDVMIVCVVQARVTQLEEQLMKMEKERDKELNSLRQEKRELLHRSHRVTHLSLH